MPDGPGLLAAVRLHQLEGFHYAAVHGGFSRAAAALPYPITEPAIHQQVRKLERALGVTLLVRGPGRRMLLTPAGRALHEFVAPFFEGLPATLRAVATGESGLLVVGCEPLYAEALCAPAFAAARRRAPGARFRLVERDVIEIAQGLRRGALDAGIASRAPVPDGLVFEELGRLGLELLVPKGHPLARRRPPIRAEDLRGHGWALYAEGTEARAFTDAALERAGIGAGTPVAEATSAGALRALVRAGLAPAFVPSLRRAGGPVRRTHADGTVAFDLTAQAGDLPRFGLWRRPPRAPSPLMEEFRAALRGLLP
jgi:DNA-binding transcriptional LysR family regulator